MKKSILFTTSVLLSITTVFAQGKVGVNTINPQAVLHVDGAKDNAATGLPSETQAANDFVVTDKGHVGINTTTPKTQFQINLPTSTRPFAVFKNTAHAMEEDALYSYLAFEDKNEKMLGWLGEGSYGKRFGVGARDGYEGILMSGIVNPSMPTSFLKTATVITRGHDDNARIIFEIMDNQNLPTYASYLSIVDAKGNWGLGYGAGKVLTEKLEVNGKIKATSINFSGLPTYANDAAAATGGLTRGDMYKTATGELRIKL